MKRRRLLSLVVLVVLLLALPVLGQGAGDYDLSWSAISTGGGDSAGGPYALVDSLASPDIGDPMTGGAYFLAGGFVPGAVAPPPNSLQAHPWPMFRHDWRHQAVSPYVGYGQPELKWTFTAGDAINSSPAIGSDGTIYFGSMDGYLYAVNPNGLLRWKLALGGPVSASSPAIGADGVIYIGSLTTNKLYAVNPDGALRWSFTTGGGIDSSPILGPDGTIYFGSYDGYVYAVRPDGVLKWSFNTGGGILSSPAIAPNGTVYVGSWNRFFYAINPDGTQQWVSFDFGNCSVGDSPALGADGTIYFGSHDTLRAFWPNGSQRWARSIGGACVLSSPAIAPGGAIYIGSRTGNLYAVRPDNVILWTFNAGNWFDSSPAIGADGTIYVGNNNKSLYAFNPDGTVKWTYLTGGVLYSSPAIGADGTVYVGSADHKLYAIGQRVPVAVTGFATGVDTDGAAGLAPAIVQVKDPVTGDPLPDVLVGGFRASFSYPPSILSVEECRLKAPFDTGECNVNNTTGTATFTAIEEPGAPWPINPLLFLAAEIKGCVGDTGTGHLFFEEIVDVNNTPLLPMAGIPFQRGDATGEGEIGVGDPLFIAQYIVGLRGLGVGPDLVNAVNAAGVKHDDGVDQITAADALYLLQYLVGIRSGCFGLLPMAVPPLR